MRVVATGPMRMSWPLMRYGPLPRLQSINRRTVLSGRNVSAYVAGLSQTTRAVGVTVATQCHGPRPMVSIGALLPDTWLVSSICLRCFEQPAAINTAAIHTSTRLFFIVAPKETGPPHEKCDGPESRLEPLD